MQSTPPELREAAAKALGDLLPASRDRYESAYKIFKDWAIGKGAGHHNRERVDGLFWRNG